MTVKLIAIDVDGTLLDSAKNLHPGVKSAIEEADRRGVLLALCTGRSPREIRELSARLPEISYGITANGADVVDLGNGGVVFADTMGTREIRTVWKTLSGVDMMFEIFTDHQVLTDGRCLGNPDHYGVGELKELVVSTRTGIKDLVGAVESGQVREAGKINIFFPSSRERDRAKALSRDLPFYITSQEPTNLEFTKREVNKGTGLKMLAESLGIKRDSIMAIGDNNNDLPMIEYAGIGVAMENGLPEVKRAADFVTKSNEDDGVAWAIRKLVFQEKSL